MVDCSQCPHVQCRFMGSALDLMMSEDLQLLELGRGLQGGGLQSYSQEGACSRGGSGK